MTHRVVWSEAANAFVHRANDRKISRHRSQSPGKPFRFRQRCVADHAVRPEPDFGFGIYSFKNRIPVESIHAGRRAGKTFHAGIGGLAQRKEMIQRILFQCLHISRPADFSGAGTVLISACSLIYMASPSLPFKAMPAAHQIMTPAFIWLFFAYPFNGQTGIASS